MDLRGEVRDKLHRRQLWYIEDEILLERLEATPFAYSSRISLVARLKHIGGPFARTRKSTLMKHQMA